jgi:hypothetical protein
MDPKEFLDGRAFDCAGEKWIATLQNAPGASAQGTDLRRVLLALRTSDPGGEVRRLEISLSHTLLNDPTKPYARTIDHVVCSWLSTSEISGTVTLLSA